MKVTNSFAPADRYLYDFRLCTYEKGWAQLDTRQDAGYYGTWINPTERKILNYCEGDIYLTECETDAELVAAVESIKTWNNENGSNGFKGIDPGWSGVEGEMGQRLVAAGLGGYLH